MDERTSDLEAAFGRRITGHEQACRRLIERAALHLRFGARRGPCPVLAGPEGSGRKALAGALAEGLGLPLRVIDLYGLEAADLLGRPRSDGGESGMLAQRLGRRPRAVVCLENLDRLGADLGPAARNRAASALRPVLEGGAWRDRYEGEACDLQDAILVATATHEDDIPPLLQPAVEAVVLCGYDRREKAAILERHLLPRLLQELGAPDGAVTLTADAVARLAEAYAPEPGVGRLARRLRDGLRRALARVALGEVDGVELAAADLEAYLGPPPLRALPGIANRAQVGASFGLVWAEGGGDVVLVEALLDAGRTGAAPQPQGVRPEAIENALAYLHARAESLRIDPAALQRGITVRATLPPWLRGAGAWLERPGSVSGLDLAALIALASVATGRPARTDVASVGWVTLHGEVRPLPGLAQMVLGAAIQGIRRVLLPREGLREVTRRLSPHTLAGLELEAVGHVEDATRRALSDVVIAPFFEM